MRKRLSSGWRQTYGFARFVVEHFLRDNCRQHAIVLTYTTLFAVVPVMTVTFAIISAIPSMQHISADIQDFIFKHFIPSSGMMVQQYLEDFSRQASHLTVVGIGMLFVTALMMMLTIEKAFNQIWRVRQERKGIVSFLRYWAALSLGPLLLGIGFAVSSYIASMEIFSSAASFVGGVVPGLRIIPFVVTALAFMLLYVAIPNCKVPLRAGFAGGLFAAFLFEMAKRGFGFFVKHFSSYKLVYGAFAAFPVFLLWIYLSWSIILLGVEITRALTLFRDESRGYRHPVLALIDVLELFWKRHRTGSVVTDVDAMDVLGRQEVEIWFDFAKILQDQRIIQRTDNGGYVLSRSLEDVDFFDFYRTLPWPLPTPADLERLHSDDHWVSVVSGPLLAVDECMEKQLRIPLATIVAGKE